MKLRRFFVLAYGMLIRSGFKRAKFLKNIKYFHHQGEDCFFSTMYFGTEPWLISIGDNVHLASGCRFVTHDVTGNMLRKKGAEGPLTNRVGTIEIGNHVVIGANAVLLYDVKIGNDVIVAAGSIVTSDLPDGCVAAGVPAKVIGQSKEYYKKIMEFSKSVNWDESMSEQERRMLQENYFWK